MITIMTARTEDCSDTAVPVTYYYEPRYAIVAIWGTWGTTATAALEYSVDGGTTWLPYVSTISADVRATHDGTTDDDSFFVYLNRDMDLRGTVSNETGTSSLNIAIF